MGNWRLCLAPHKCVFTIFSRNKKDKIKENTINLRIRNEILSFDPNPKFLGVKFDKNLNGSAQINDIKEKIKGHLNILRILSYKKQWKLYEKTLINIYKSLIRSILDYSAFFSSYILNSQIEQLERIQNTALRVIFRVNQTDHIYCDNLKKKAKVETIKERLESLPQNYFKRTHFKSNELIEELIISFKQTSEHRKDNS